MGKNDQAVWVVSPPNISNDPASTRCRVPIGHVNVFDAVRATCTDGMTMRKALLDEWCAIVTALVQVPINFVVLEALTKFLPVEIFIGARGQFGLKTATLPKFDDASLSFPRDITTVLPNGTCLFDGDNFHAIKNPPKKKMRYIASPYGTGGRILMARGVALVSERYFKEIESIKKMISGHKPEIEPLRRSGLRVGTLPVAVFREERLGAWALLPDDHLDRSFMLLVGQDHGLHLIADPELHSGYRGPFDLPTMGPNEALAAVKKTCEALGIKFHAPKQLRIPMSLCMQQFPNGRVIMTSGDDELQRLVGDIVGEDNVIVTQVPITHFPVFLQGGIHCLIGELPRWLLHIQ